MPGKRTQIASFLVILASLLAGCQAGPTNHTPPAAANACTPYPKPAPELQSPVAFRGANAFAYMIGLVCDHSGDTPMPRARVPGTANQTAGATYLADALATIGFTVTHQRFNGTDFETIMRGPAGQASSYQQYMTECDGSDRAGLARMRTLPFDNIVGTGGTIGGPILLLMAHYDSKRYATQDPVYANKTEPVLGANDGAAGVGVLLELARVEKQQNHPWEIRILLDDGEDGFEDCHPLAGTTVYAERLPQAERARVKAVVLLDMIGDLSATFTKGCGADHALADRIWDIAARLDVPQFHNQYTCSVVDDHVPFEERNMNAVDIIDMRNGYDFPPYWHTTHDTPDKISPEMLSNMGRILTTLIDELPVA